MKRLFMKYYLPGILVPVLGALIFFGHKKAREHVDYITEAEGHSLNCASCHLYEVKEGFIYNMLNEQYLSPIDLALSGDGATLYVVAQEGNALLVVDVAERRVLHRIGVGVRPYSVVLDPAGNKAFVSNQWSDNVMIIDLDRLEITDTLKTGGGPAGMAIDNEGRQLYVVNSYSSDISIFDLQSKKELTRLAAGNNPTGAGISPDGRQIFVTSRRTLPMDYGTPPMTELTVSSTGSRSVRERRIFQSAYLMQNVAFTPSGDLALATLVRPKNLIPSIQVEEGWMMNHGIGIIERTGKKRIIQLLLDEPDAYYADPFDITVTPDGTKAFVSHAGVNVISVISMDSLRMLLESASDEQLRQYSNYLGTSGRFVECRIPTGSNPKGLAVSPDGKWLYAAERLEDRIAVISIASLRVVDQVDLGGPRRITVSRKGRRLFNNAGRTFHDQFSCYTCHPDEHEDGLVYNMAGIGRDLANVQTLRDIGDTPPFKWNGKNQSIHKQDGMRFSMFLTRTETFNYHDLDALVCFIRTGIKDPPNLQFNPDGHLTETQLRGKAIFERTHDNFGNLIPVNNRCITCHPPPYYTNLQMADVGTLSETDDSMMFDTPQLNSIYASAPYLHDGKAATLEEIWTKFNDHDQHGIANDMTKTQLNDLVNYLKSLRPGRFEQSLKETGHDSTRIHLASAFRKR